MKKIILLLLVFSSLLACKNNTKPNETQQQPEPSQKYDSFIVKESIPASSYLYLLGEQGDKETWFAISKRDLKIGDKFYYKDPLVMKDFYSKELNRPFDEVIFLMNIAKDPAELDLPSAQAKNSSAKISKPSGKITTEKQALKVEKPKGGIRIAELYKNPKKYEGKNILIRGEVIKFLPEIMNVNWVHLQDGSSFEGKYDLTITTTQQVKVGDIITFKGFVVLNKDFGYGYFYDILIEKATLIN
jgi:hypothetical protein